jgi:hypothetical protein
MEKMMADLRDLLKGGELKCSGLGKRAGARKLATFAAGSQIVEAGMGTMSALMQLRDHPLTSMPGLQVFSKLSADDEDESMAEVYIFPMGATYVVNLLRIVGIPGHKDYRSLITKTRKLFRFGSLREAMALALRIVNAGDERGISRVLRNAEKETSAKQGGIS